MIIFTTEKIGDWKFQVFGIGIPPTPFSETIATASMNKTITKNFKFKNPFMNEITV